jgi:hypothetical protein
MIQIMQTWRFPLIIGLSIVFGAPVLGEMALATGDLVDAGIRYLAALGLSWFGVSSICALAERYDAENDALRRAEDALALELRMAAVAAEREQADRAAQARALAEAERGAATAPPIMT